MIYTIFDIETTGLSVNGGDDILSFGFIRINSNFEIKESGVYYFYKPEFRVENPGAFKVHRLTREMLEPHADEFYDNIKKVFALCYNSIIIGKNNTKFDMPFLQNFIKKHCPTVPPLQYLKTFDIQSRFKPVFQRITGSTKTGTLTDYVKALGVSIDEINDLYNKLPTKDDMSRHMHGALFDCAATYIVFKKLCEMENIKP